VRAPGARADTLPLPPLSTPATAETPSLPAVPTEPSLPVTVPTLPLPGQTTTDPGGGGGDREPATGGSDASTADTSQANSPSTSAAPAGAIRLRDGRISIPASSVVLPLRLVLSRVAVRPARVSRARQQLQAGLRVLDSRGYLVRGVRVEVRSTPDGRIRAGATRSAVDGSVRLAFRTTALLALRSGVRLRLTFAGSTPRRQTVRRVVVVPVVPAG
jgi:hypothetical protein